MRASIIADCKPLNAEVEEREEKREKSSGL